MIPSVQFQSCNDTLTTIHKDILEKLDLPMATTTMSLCSDNDIQLPVDATQFESDQILMHQVEFNESDIAISQDCHSIELGTSDEMIDGTENIINYTIIGNGLILIEGSQMDFDEETKDGRTNDLPIKGSFPV